VKEPPEIQTVLKHVKGLRLLIFALGLQVCAEGKGGVLLEGQPPL